MGVENAPLKFGEPFAGICPRVANPAPRREMSRCPSFFSAGFVAMWLAPWAAAIEITRTLDPSIDTVGQQILTVQTYTSGTTTVFDLGIYDTGAAVVSFAAYANEYFPQPHLNPGGAGGQGINGRVIGDVSQPGTVLVGGFQDFTIDVDVDTFTFDVSVSTSPTRAVPGIQAFVGSLDGSPNLPTLAGTPIHKPSVAFPGGSAAHVSFSGIDFASSLGLTGQLFIPTFDLVTPGQTLIAKAGSTQPAVIPLIPLGLDNYGNEGSDITVVPNPTVAGVGLGMAGGSTLVTAGSMLFDTGAQVSLISTGLAAGLGLDLGNPETTISVKGAAGEPVAIPGFTLGELVLGAAIDGAEADDTLRFLDVPVYVYDIGVPGLDGILGMNLFNQADEMLIDLINGQFSVSFYETLPEGGGGEAFAALGALFATGGMSFPVFAGSVAPALGLGPVVPVPEPGAMAVLAGALVALARTKRSAGRALSCATP
jgi:hypothetical protein